MTTVPTPVDVLGALAERVRVGDAAAEAELVEQLYAGVLAIACARLRDREAAREVAQETMLTLVSALRGGKLRDPSKVTPFAHGITVNMVRVHRRDIRYQPTVEPLRPEHLRVMPSDHVEAQEETRALRDALATLEPVDRRILSLTLIEGLAPMAIGEQVGLSAQLVRTRKSRSIKKIVDVARRLTRLGSRSHLHK